MGRLPLFAALFLLLPIAALGEEARDAGWTTVTLPEIDGFTLSLELPPGWAHDSKSGGDTLGLFHRNGEKPQYLSAFYHHPDHKDAVSVMMFVYPSPLSLEEFSEIAGSVTSGYSTLQQGADESFGRPSFSQTLSKSGSTDPYRREAVTVLHDRVGILASFNLWNPNSFADLAQDFDRIIKRITVATAADLEPNAGWTRVALPELDGFVLSVEVPSGWEHEFHADHDEYGYYKNKKNGEQPKILRLYMRNPEDPAGYYLYFNINAYPGDIGIEDFADINYMLGPYPNMATEQFQEKGFDESFGRRSFSVTTFAEKTRAVDPFNKEAVTTYHGRVAIHASVATSMYDYPDQAVFFDRIIKSIAVTPVAEIDPEQVWQLFLSPEITVTPGKYELEAFVSLAMPPRWQAEEVEVVTAGAGGAKAGRMILDFYPREGSEDVGVTLQMDGTAYRERLSAEGFLATRDPVLASMANDLREVETEAGVAVPNDYQWRGFCLSQRKTRRFKKSGPVEVKTFDGKDAFSGEDVRLRVYTAGGVTLACNVIFKAPPDEFARLAPQVDRMLRSLKVQAGGLIMMK